MNLEMEILSRSENNSHKQQGVNFHRASVWGLNIMTKGGHLINLTVTGSILSQGKLVSSAR